MLLMSNILKFSRFNFVLSVLLFGIEIPIAKFAHDQIIRPYIGDLLVVMLIYCFLKSFPATPYFTTAIAVLAFSYLLETLQYFQIVNILGLEKSKFTKILIGTSFERVDLVAYTLGIAFVIYFERVSTKRKTKPIIVLN